MTKAMHRIQRKNKFLPYLLTLPSMLLFSMFTFYPFLKTVALSFFLTDKRGNPTKWAGISNWVRVLSKETFWKIIAITLEIAGINLVFTFGLAIFFALLSSQKKKGGKLYQTMYALPMAIASSPAAAIFLFIFRQKNGVVNSLLGGANIGWTTEMPYAMWAVCIMTIWMNVGISYIFLLVGFRAVPQDLIESAYLDGAGVWARIKDPNDSINAGIAFITEDRQKLGLMLHASVLENATIIGLREKIKGFFVNIKKFPPLIEPLLKELRVKTPSVWTEAVYLSGGNQQKVVLAKWLYAEQGIYIFDEPTRGIDVNAKAEFYKQMSNLTKQGKCILMISSDMPELISMSDRVLVVRDGRIDCELKGEQINEQEIIKRALGVNKDG